MDILISEDLDAPARQKLSERYSVLHDVTLWKHLRAQAFGMRLRVFDPFVKADSLALAGLDVALCEKLEEALAKADFVTVHCPLTAETKHLFNARAFAAMKPGAFFINTSRGGVMDE